MLDNISLKVDGYTPVEFDTFLKGIGRDCGSSGPYVKFLWHNLRVEYYPNAQVLRVRNSVHKFFNAVLNEGVGQPVNNTDFFHKQFCDLVGFLTISFNRPATDFQLYGKFEYGLNVNTLPYQPFEVINRYRTCVLNSVNEYYTNPSNHGKPIERTCYFTDFRVKVYDKGAETSIRGAALMRFEVVLDGSKKIRQVLKEPKVTLETLTHLSAWSQLSRHLMKVYDATRKLPLLQRQIKTADLLPVHAYCDKLISEDLRVGLSRWQYKKMQKEQARVFATYNDSEDNCHNTIRERLVSKLNQIMSSLRIDSS